MKEIKNKITTVMIPQELYDQVILIAASNRQSLNDLIHMLLEEYVQVPMSNPSNLSVHSQLKSL